MFTDAGLDFASDTSSFVSEESESPASSNPSLILLPTPSTSNISLRSFLSGDSENGIEVSELEESFDSNPSYPAYPATFLPFNTGNKKFIAMVDTIAIS